MYLQNSISFMKVLYMSYLWEEGTSYIGKNKIQIHMKISPMCLGKSSRVESRHLLTFGIFLSLFMGKKFEWPLTQIFKKHLNRATT